MAKAHAPSHRQAVVFFLFMLLVGVFILTWGLFLNYGTLAVSGPTPFKANVGAESLLCEAPPCNMRLKPGHYMAIFKKEGFRDTTQSINVKRWQSTAAEVDFSFIPVVQEMGDIVLPLKEAPLVSHFLGKSRFENFPSESGDALFSPHAKKILFVLGKERYLYDIEKSGTQKTNLRATDIVSWLGEEIIAFNVEGGKHMVKRIGGKNDVIATFERPFEKPQLLGSPSGNYILITEEGGQGGVHYIVDVAAKTRRRIDTLPRLARAQKWLGDKIVFEAMESSKPSVLLFNAADMTHDALDATSSAYVTEGPAESLLFLSEINREKTESATGISIEDAIAQAQKKSTAEKSVETLYVTQFFPDEKKYLMLAEIPVDAEDHIVHMNYDEAKKTIYMDKSGTLIEVILGNL